MTLCKFRPQRTYDAQFIIEKFDADGLLKMLRGRVASTGGAGEARTMYYIGALAALETLFTNAEQGGMVDYPTDFLELLDAALGE